MHPFRAFIYQYNMLSDSEWTEVERKLSRVTYMKGELLLESGKVCKKLYFLESGFLRYFTYKEGEDVTKFFTEAPYCFTAQRSFTGDLPSQESIEAVVDSEVWEMSKTDAFVLLKYLRWSEFIRKLIQEVQFYTEQILDDVQNNTAEERYIKMIEQNDPILVNVPLKDIASYLGIAPQSLSRIRKKYWDSQRKLT